MDLHQNMTDEDRLRSYKEFVRRKSEGQRQYRARLKAEREAKGIGGWKRKPERRQTNKQPPSRFQHKENVVQHKRNMQNYDSEDYEYIVMHHPRTSQDLESNQNVFEEEEDAGEPEPDIVKDDHEHADIVVVNMSSEDALNAAEEFGYGEVDEEEEESHVEAVDPHQAIRTELTPEHQPETYDDDHEEEFQAKRCNIIRLMDVLPKDIRLSYLSEIESILENAFPIDL